MPCPATKHACLRCTTTPAAIAARAELSGLTIHASAARPQRPVVLDLAAAAHQIRLKASRSRDGQQLHGQNYTDTLTLLRGQSRATVDELMKQADLNSHTRLMLKLELYG